MASFPGGINSGENLSGRDKFNNNEAWILEPISSTRPVELTTLLLSSPDTSESPRSAALKLSPVLEEWERPGKTTGSWILM